VKAREIETAGDCFFIVFTKPSDALEVSLPESTPAWRALSAEVGRPGSTETRIHVGKVGMKNMFLECRQSPGSLRHANRSLALLCLGYLPCVLNLGCGEGRWAPDVKIYAGPEHESRLKPEASSIYGVAVAFNPGTIRTAVATTPTSRREGSRPPTIAVREAATWQMDNSAIRPFQEVTVQRRN